MERACKHRAKTCRGDSRSDKEGCGGCTDCRPLPNCDCPQDHKEARPVGRPKAQKNAIAPTTTNNRGVATTTTTTTPIRKRRDVNYSSMDDLPEEVLNGVSPLRLPVDQNARIIVEMEQRYRSVRKPFGSPGLESDSPEGNRFWWSLSLNGEEISKCKY